MKIELSVDEIIELINKIAPVAKTDANEKANINLKFGEITK